MKSFGKTLLALAMTGLLAGCIDSSNGGDDTNGKKNPPANNVGDGNNGGNNGENNGGNNPPPNSPPDNASTALQGSWQSACFENQQGKTIDWTTTFSSGGQGRIVYHLYSDGNCESLEGEAAVGIKYTVGKQITVASGWKANEIDITITSDPENIIGVGKQLPDIVAVDGNTLYLGDDEKEPSGSRPSDLDFEEPYSKL